MNNFKQAFGIVCTESLKKTDDFVSSVESLNASELVEYEKNLEIQLESLRYANTQLELLTNQVEYTNSLSNISKENLIQTCNICNSVGLSIGVDKESLINVESLKEVNLTNKAYSISLESIKDIATAAKDKVVSIIKKILELIDKIISVRTLKEKFIKNKSDKILNELHRIQSENKDLPIVTTDDIPCLKYGYIKPEELKEYGRCKDEVCNKLVSLYNDISSVGNLEENDGSNLNIIERIKDINTLTHKYFPGLSKTNYFFVGASHGCVIAGDKVTYENLEPIENNTNVEPLDIIGTIETLRKITTSKSITDDVLNKIKKSGDEMVNGKSDMSNPLIGKLYQEAFHIITHIGSCALDLEEAIIKVVENKLNNLEA